KIETEEECIDLFSSAHVDVYVAQCECESEECEEACEISPNASMNNECLRDLAVDEEQFASWLMHVRSFVIAAADAGYCLKQNCYPICEELVLEWSHQLASLPESLFIATSVCLSEGEIP